MQRSHSAAPSVEDDESKLTPADKTVSSRGCNRLFIVSVLLSALEHLKSATHGRVFPAPPEVVSTWLETAKTYCSAASDTTVYGGPAFNIHDPSTHWSEPQQFLTWWKNFVERKRKQESLLRDASYNGDDERRLQRARFCRHILHLCSLIRRRHQELQQLPDDGMPQPQQPHLGSNDHLMLNTNAMGVSPRPMMHPAAAAKLLPTQPSPAPSMLAFAHVPTAAPSYAAGSSQMHVPTMAHMLPPQAQQQPAAAAPAMRTPSQRQPEPSQRTMSTRSSFSPVMLPESSPAQHATQQPPQHQRSVSASSASAADGNGHCDEQHPRQPHASSPAGTCCAGCRKSDSPMTALFDSITSAYDPPEPDDDYHHGVRGSTAQKGSSMPSLDRSKSAELPQPLGSSARKPSYDFPVRKRRRNRSGSSATSSCGNMSETFSDGHQDQPSAAAGASTGTRAAAAAPRKESVSPSDASIKAAIAKICNSNDDIWDKFDTLLQEFQKAVQLKQAQIDLLKRFLERSGEDERQAKRRRYAALGTFDLGARYSSVQEMMEAALAESGTQPTPERQSRKVCCSDSLCYLCGSSVQAIWTFFCSQGGETLERALVLHAGYTIPEAQAVARHLENLAIAFQQEAATSATRADQEETKQSEEQTSVPLVEKGPESASEELGVNS